MIRSQRHRTATGETDKRKALAFETRWRASLLDVADAGVVPMTLLKAVTRYQLEDLRPLQQKPETARKSDHNMTLIKAYFGDVPVHEITGELIGRWRSDMLAHGLSAATVNRRLADLRAVMRRAVRWGALVKVPQIDMVRQPRQVERYLTADEYTRIYKECPPHLKRLVQFLAGTGARLSEATGLTWGQVDLTGERCHVTFADTKSGKGRGVPLPKDVTHMLKKIRPADPAPDDRVFLYRRDDGELLPFDNPKTAWRAARGRAGLTWVRIHDLRHYYASRLVRAGVSLYSVQRLLGHSTPSLTQRYAALRPEDLDSQVAALD